MTGTGKQQVFKPLQQLSPQQRCHLTYRTSLSFVATLLSRLLPRFANEHCSIAPPPANNQEQFRMQSFIRLVIFCVVIGLTSSALAAPKNTFRPWKIGMGNGPTHSMTVPEPAKYEVIIGQIARPKGVKDLKANMPPPAGPEPELQIPEVRKTDGRLRHEKEKTDGKLKKEKEMVLEQNPRRVGSWRATERGN